MCSFAWFSGAALLICGAVFLILGGIEGIAILGIGAVLIVGGKILSEIKTIKNRLEIFEEFLEADGFQEESEPENGKKHGMQ